MSAMKANPVCRWQIALEGRTRGSYRQFTGTLDEALSHADEMESGVSFVVYQYVITRLERVKVKKGKAA